LLSVDVALCASQKNILSLKLNIVSVSVFRSKVLELLPKNSFPVINNQQHENETTGVKTAIELGDQNLPTMRTTNLRGKLKSSQAYCSDS
jgi:hypothetical protein